MFILCVRVYILSLTPSQSGCEDVNQIQYYSMQVANVCESDAIAGSAVLYCNSKCPICCLACCVSCSVANHGWFCRHCCLCVQPKRRNGTTTAWPTVTVSRTRFWPQRSRTVIMSRPMLLVKLTSLAIGAFIAMNNELYHIPGVLYFDSTTHNFTLLLRVRVWYLLCRLYYLTFCMF